MSIRLGTNTDKIKTQYRKKNNKQHGPHRNTGVTVTHEGLTNTGVTVTREGLTQGPHRNTGVTVTHEGLTVPAQVTHHVVKCHSFFDCIENLCNHNVYFNLTLKIGWETRTSHDDGYLQRTHGVLYEYCSQDKPHRAAQCIHTWLIEMPSRLGGDYRVIVKKVWSWT